MAITRVEIKDFFVFKGEFNADFCPGVNVLIGANGTGKTTLLKALHRLCGNGKSRSTEEYFFPLDETWNFLSRPFEYIRMQVNLNETESRISVRFVRSCGAGDGVIDYSIMTSEGYVMYKDMAEYEDAYTKSNSGTYTGLDYVYTTDNFKPLSSIFIPSTNLLPQAKGLLEMIDAYNMDFDITHVDIIKNAQRPTTRVLQPNCSKVISRLSDMINGEVIYDEGRFYIKKKTGEMVEFLIEASGVVRLGLLWKLLRNGLLEAGTTLFWDEPENSLNPEFIPTLVDVLLELADNGVQIFLATHDYNLARFFDVRKNKKVPVKFHNLVKDDDGYVQSLEESSYMKLPDNHLESANGTLFKAVVESAMEVPENG